MFSDNSTTTTMKKFFKILFSSIGIILICLMIIGQIANSAMKPYVAEVSDRSDFKRMIERADRDCPIPAAMGKGAVTGIKLENDYLTYYLSYDKNFINVLSSLNNEQKVKEGLIMCFLCINAQGNNQGDLIMDLLIRFGYGMKVVINQSGNGRFECSASVNEIKNLRDKYKLNPHEALYGLLSLSVENEKSDLPMILDEGMIMTDYTLERENIAITVLIDEDLYSMDVMCENKNIIKAAMIEEGLNQPESKALLDLCKVSHTGLIYRMVGDKTRKKCEVLISSNEIRRIVPIPANVDIH